MTLILSGTDGLSDVDGSAATPAIRGTDANTGIFFPAADTIAFSEGGAEIARFDSSGNFGIGTSSPANRLSFGANIGRYFALYEGTAGADLYGIGTETSALTFKTAAAERMRIDSSGNLLVNTTSQINNGKVSCVNSNNVFSASCSIAASGYYNLSQNNNGFVFYAESGTNTFRGSASYNGTGISYNSASDYRLKNVIGQIPNPLETVSALKPCQFVWKETGETDVGFIAHELQELFPKAVSGEKDAVDAEGNPKYQGIDTSFLVATLTAAIQEQQALIQSLTTRLTALENK
jgi:hypothetical protein